MADGPRSSLWQSYSHEERLIDTTALTSTEVNPHRGGVFVHISHGSDDPHRLLMGLQMAVTMAEDKKDVAGVNSDDLRPGVTVARKDRFFSFTSGRILSIDY